MGIQFPDDYPPSSFCRSCGRDFSNTELFDRHRTGRHQPLERRCLTDAELRKAGLRPLTDGEMESTRRHRHRIGFGIEMWADPVQLEQARDMARAAA